jgi:hypothetical protein
LCDGDKLWTTLSQTSKDKIRYDGVLKDDGIFHMLYNDFVSLFDVLDICNYDASCNYFSEKMAVHKNAAMFKIDVTVLDSYIIELHQPTLRGETPDRVADGVCRATLIVA